MEKNTLNGSGKLLVIGGSAGSLEVLLEVFPKLRKDISIPIVIVLHRKNTNDPILGELLATKTKLKVKEIEEKEPVLPGIIYLVPGDYHVLFEKDHTFSLDASESVNYSRPSIDVVMQSAADVYGSGLTCILLSGANADGTKGFIYAKEHGSTTVAQLPSSAEVGFMPEQAIQSNSVDHVLDIPEIAAYINQL